MLPLHPSLKMNVQNMIKITFPDDSVREYAEGTTAMQIAESISSRLAQDVLAASVNGEIWDLTRPITSDSAVKLFKWDDAEGKHAFWRVVGRNSFAKIDLKTAFEMDEKIKNVFAKTKLSEMFDIVEFAEIPIGNESYRSIMMENNIVIEVRSAIGVQTKLL